MSAAFLAIPAASLEAVIMPPGKDPTDKTCDKPPTVEAFKPTPAKIPPTSALALLQTLPIPTINVAELRPTVLTPKVVTSGETKPLPIEWKTVLARGVSGNGCRR